jgi:hypothetical protein
MIDRETKATQDSEDQLVLTTVTAIQVASDLLPDPLTGGYKKIRVNITPGEVLESAAEIMRTVAEKEMGASASGHEDLKNKSWLWENDLPVPTEEDVWRAEEKIASGEYDTSIAEFLSSK